MELILNIDESKFKDVLDRELEAFSKEELHDIIRECLINCLSNTETLQSLFIKKQSDYPYNEYYSASDLLRKSAESIDLHPAFAEIQNKAIDYLKENQSKIINDLFLSILVNGISNSLIYNTNFSENLKNNIIRSL